MKIEIIGNQSYCHVQLLRNLVNEFYVDLSGQDEFKQMREEHIGAAQAFLLVYSITDINSLDECELLHDSVLAFRSDSSVRRLMLVGNKVQSFFYCYGSGAY